MKFRWYSIETQVSHAIFVYSSAHGDPSQEEGHGGPEVHTTRRKRLLMGMAACRASLEAQWAGLPTRGNESPRARSGFDRLSDDYNLDIFMPCAAMPTQVFFLSMLFVILWGRSARMFVL